MYALTVAADGRVVRIQTNTDAAAEGEVLYESIPPRPESREGYTWHLHEKAQGGLEWRESVMPEPFPEGPTKAEQEQNRASAYRERVDPITCEIQRLRDMGGTEAEIAEAEQRRAEAVRVIKEEFPYPASAGSADETAQEVAK